MGISQPKPTAMPSMPDPVDKAIRDSAAAERRRQSQGGKAQSFVANAYAAAPPTQSKSLIGA